MIFPGEVMERATVSMTEYTLTLGNAVNHSSDQEIRADRLHVKAVF